MSEEWGLSKEYCTKLVRDGGTNMVSAADTLAIPTMSCVAHSLHLVVAGAMIKKKKTIDQPEDLPAWAAEVSNESAEPIMEHEEDEQLSREDRDQMDTLRDLAVDEMETVSGHLHAISENHQKGKIGSPNARLEPEESNAAMLYGYRWTAQRDGIAVGTCYNA
ncbi:hypothetical protein PR001_g21492 [Phytophthora rubi]|nr:hypothetical protein PR002_g22269 [Phytophthora rubi]KAE8990416.1 hypothetical protein PR001_g21492 [Phytophthora rubi]